MKTVIETHYLFNMQEIDCGAWPKLIGLQHNHYVMEH